MRLPTWPFLAAVLLVGCQSPPPSRTGSPDSARAREVAPRPLPVSAPLNRRDIEISGLTWYGDTLVVLPQYPSRYAGRKARQLYGVSQSALRRAIADTTAPPLDPFPIPLQAEGFGEHVAAYEGCEAIVFEGNRVYIVTEGAAEEAGMRGHLFRGRASPGLRRIRVQRTAGRPLPQQVQLSNMSYEALTMRGDTVIALFEVSGARVNRAPRAYRFSPDLQFLGTVPFPTLEYRLTDATALDAQNRFWVVNYFYPGDDDLLRPATDSIAHRFGRGRTHRTSEVVERLVEYKYTPRGIRRTDEPPVWFALGDAPRNWEGLVRFEDGFLVATDTFPSTLLAYVPAPQS